MIAAPRFVLLMIALVSSGCDSKPKSNGAPADSSPPGPEAPGSDDQQAAIEVKPASEPKYALAKLTEAELSALLAKTGWTPTAGGKASSGSGSGVRVSAYKKDAEGGLECKVSVRCSEPGVARLSGAHQPGAAYYASGECAMTVEVRRGIRKKSAESRRVLELLLAAEPG